MILYEYNKKGVIIIYSLGFKYEIGQVFMMNLDGTGSVQNGYKPVVIIQNDIGNKNSTTLIVATITSQKKKDIPTHVNVMAGEGGLTKDSTIMLEQIRTVNKSDLDKYVGKFSRYTQKKIGVAQFISMPLPSLLSEEDLEEFVNFKKKLAA